MKIIKRIENPVCIYTYYEDEEGNYNGHCLFKHENHPVNKSLFKMSGAIRETDEKTTG